MIETTVLHVTFVLARVASFVSFFPVFSGRRLPRLVKVGLAVSLTAIWVGPANDNAPLGAINGPQDWIVLAILMLREITLGAGLGFAFGLLIEPARMAGAYIGREMGLSLASIADPSSGAPVGIVGQLFEWITIVMLFVLDVHHVLLYVINLSLQTLRVGERALVLPAMEFVRQSDVAHQWSLLIAAPVAIVLFLTLICMGLLVRAVPQMNIFSVGFAMRIMFGLGSLLLFMPAMLHMIARSLSQSSTILNLF